MHEQLADENGPVVNPGKARISRHEPLRLAVLFGAIYFVQGIGEPTEGLIAQPVRALLKSWEYSTHQISTFSTIIALPWSLKPLYGVISDCVPLFRSRRRSYLILTTGATVVGLAWLYVFPPAHGAYWTLLLLLTIPTIGVAFSDVVADALMIEKGQPIGMTGRLQSVQWAAMYGATILTGWLGGQLVARGQASLGFLICAVAMSTTLLLTIFWIKEPPVERSGEWRQALGELRIAATHRPAWFVAAFLFLWNFNPFSTSVLYMHMTDHLRFSESFYGTTTSLFAVASVVAAALYGVYCRRVRFSILVHLSIALGVVSTLAYWWLDDRTSAVWISLIVGAAYMTGSLVQLDLAARVCPPAAAGTTFALFMSMSNLSVTASTWTGGYIYEAIESRWSRDMAFDTLVAVGSLFTAGCWLLLPTIGRGLLRASNPDERPTPS